MHITTKHIIKISLISFILLFSSLIYLDSIHTIKTTQIKNITIKNINQYVQIEGKIGKQNIIKNMSFLNIYDKSSNIPAIMFDLNKTLNKKKHYSFTGKITTYKSKPELIIYEIKEK